MPRQKDVDDLLNAMFKAIEDKIDEKRKSQRQSQSSGTLGTIVNADYDGVVRGLQIAQSLMLEVVQNKRRRPGS